METDELLLRLDVVEDRMRLLQREVDSIRLELRGRAAAPAPPPRPRAPFPAATPTRTRPARPPAPPKRRREIDWAELFGARALAWAGGVVTLLGVVFFFVLAVNRGWIGPGTRVGFGAAASAIVFAVGLWLRRRYGETYSSLAAVGAGIAGAYATLAAATVLYHLVSTPLALVAATGIAAAALGVSLVWRAEILAALGLVGAICAPALLAVDAGLTAGGTAFAAVMSAAAFAVGVRMRWRWLLGAAGLASAPQVVALAVHAPIGDAGTIAVACVFAFLYLATGVAAQLRSRTEALRQLPTIFVLASIGVAWIAADQLFGPGGGVSDGVALLVASAAFAVVSVAVWLRRQRELGTLLGTIALAAAAVGVAFIVSGTTLAYTFAAEAVVLAVAARRLREPRVLLGSIGYLVLALAHALVFDAPPRALFEAAREPASGAGTLAAAAVAGLAVAWVARTPWNDSRERGVLRFLAPVVAEVRARTRGLRIAASALSALLVADALSLAVLWIFEAAWQRGGVVAAFHRGEVALTLLWSIAGLAALVVASRRRAATARRLALAWLALTALKVVGYDGTQLVGLGFSLAFVALAAALLLAGFLRELLEARKRPAPETIAAVLGAVAFGVAAIHPLDGEPGRGAAVLAIAFVLLAFAAPVFRRARDLSTLFWTPGVWLVSLGTGLLLHGTWRTLAWALAAGVLAALVVTTREKRLQLASLFYVVLTAAAAFDAAPPSHLVVARLHPAHGLAGLLLFAAALAAFARAARDARPAATDATGYDAVAGWLDERQERWRATSLWAAAVIVVYSASLAILELAVRLSSASLHTDFQRGHSAVSALWGALGLALLYVGLRRRRRALRLGGFALFAVSLAKLFLYDLSQLSSITRALSFLAVGVVLLLAGFFVQRLSAQLGEQGGPPAYS